MDVSAGVLGAEKLGQDQSCSAARKNLIEINLSPSASNELRIVTVSASPKNMTLWRPVSDQYLTAFIGS
jgi:hypothetical protein